MNVLLFIILLAASFSFWGLKMTVLMAISPRRAQTYMQAESARISRLIFRFAAMCVGLRVDLDRPSGETLPERFLLISNHQSLADIPFIIAAFPENHLRFVAKQGLGKFIPMVSPLLRYQHHALIRRTGKRSSTYRAIRRLARSSTGGTIPVVFPEGTRSKTGLVGPFHDGAARMLLQMHPLPVVTVAVDGGYVFSRLWAVFTRISRATYRGKITSIRPAPKNKNEIITLLTECRTEIVEQLEAWRSHDSTG
jgi:1-acyl-sn-glycerol-3-phosphate acyltransferase